MAVGLIEPLAQTIAYNFHERAWARSTGTPLPAMRLFHVH